MGHSITAEVVQRGKREAYPLYVWFIDDPDGPVWQEMDKAFDTWNARTGPHLAFFVDPFQREEWATSFLSEILDSRSVRPVLRARKEAQRFFRERLAERACSELWIPSEALPVAIVACRWNGRSTLACPLADRQSVRLLLEALSDLGKQIGPMERYVSPFEDRISPRDETERLRVIEDVLRKARLSSRRLFINSGGVSRIARDAVDEEAIGPFMRWLDRESPAPENESHLAGSLTRAGLASFDDLLSLASDLVGRARNTALRNPNDRDARFVAQFLPEFLALVRNLHDGRNRLSAIAARRDLSEEERITQAAHEVLHLRLEIGDRGVDGRLVERMGDDTFRKLSEDSRAALRASEAIYTLSEAISELHEDLSAVLLGYWKASEIEGRRLIVDLVALSGGVPVWNGRTRSVDMIENRRQVLEEFTAGTVGWVLQNARFAPDSRWCGLPLPQLGERYQLMSRTARNRFIHRTNLQDTHELATARGLVADQPDGILPTAIRCMLEVGSLPILCEEMVGLSRLVDGVQKGNAASAVPSRLAELKGAARTQFAVEVVQKLGRNWLLHDKRSGREWVRELLDVAGRAEREE